MTPNGTRTFFEIESLIKVLNKKLKLPDRANCFNAVELFLNDSQKQRFVGSEEFVAYISKNFTQISLCKDLTYGDITIIWARSNSSLPQGQITVGDLLQKREGYPFGLIIEHAFVSIDTQNIFEKVDPKSSTAYRIISKEEALAPYVTLNGFELTRHRRFI